jgi:hypothetical protein
MVKLLCYSHMQWCRNTNINYGPGESTADKKVHEHYATPRSNVLPDKLNSPYFVFITVCWSALHPSYPQAKRIHYTPGNLISFKIHFNTALPCKPMSFKSLHSLQVSPPKSSMHFYSPPRVPLVLSSRPSGFYHPSNMWWRLQTIRYNETLCRSHIQNVKLLGTADTVTSQNVNLSSWIIQHVLDRPCFSITRALLSPSFTYLLTPWSRFLLEKLTGL